MRETISWSYGLLTKDEQALFRRLAVFVSSCRVDEAAAVGTAAGELDSDVFDVVASLIDKNLLERTDSPDGELRIRMFETLREFGHEQLLAANEEGVTRDAYAVTYLQLAQSLKTLSPPRWLLSFEAIAGPRPSKTIFARRWPGLSAPVTGQACYSSPSPSSTFGALPPDFAMFNAGWNGRWSWRQMLRCLSEVWPISYWGFTTVTVALGAGSRSSGAKPSGWPRARVSLVRGGKRRHARDFSRGSW